MTAGHHPRERRERTARCPTLEALLAEKAVDTGAARHCGCAQRRGGSARGVARTQLQPGDSVEIVRARQGG